jgi:hypothetical protein
MLLLPSPTVEAAVFCAVGGIFAWLQKYIPPAITTAKIKQAANQPLAPIPSSRGVWWSRYIRGSSFIIAPLLHDA